MKVLKKIIFSAVPVLLLSQLFPVTAFAENQNDFKYTLKSNGTAEISCVNTEIEKAEIPSEIDGHPITSLAENCFYDCASLKSVIIPDTVTEIGNFAFCGCSSLKEFSVPENVGKIGNYAFDMTEDMISFDVAENNTAYQSVDGVLYDKSGSTLIKYPESKADKNYTLPDSCSKIENWAFIGARYLESIDMNQVKIIGEDAFCWCVELKEVTIPEGVVALDGAVFSYCKNLEKVHLPSTLVSVGEKCFYSCTSLKELNLPEGLKKIGAYAICHCTSLKELTVPKSLESINIDCMGYQYDEEKQDYSLQDDFKLYVYKKSVGYMYAYTNQIPYEFVKTGEIYYILIGVILVIIVILIIAIIKVLKSRNSEKEANL